MEQTTDQQNQQSATVGQGPQVTFSEQAVGLRARKSIGQLNEQEIKQLMIAWRGMKARDPSDPQSFFALAGLHGEPFRGAGWGSSAYWGGYCNHGNVLFPTWHRAYLLKLEEALRSVEGCADVTLPYWDETDEASLSNGIPEILTMEFYDFPEGKQPNPLRSFVFSRNIVDNVSGDNGLYSKPAGYETKRFPLSGLVGTPEAEKATIIHNKKFSDWKSNELYLNQNIVNWLKFSVIIKGQPLAGDNVLSKYKNCLKAPNYTLFSNTTSAQEWNANASAEDHVVALESPHNSIHLAVGGFEVAGQGNFSPIEGANGDMGENDTASFDPIFYFHHCNVDRVFWLWQNRHTCADQTPCTDKLEIIDQYPGTNSVDSQGPTPGVLPNTWLTLESPLDPFKKANGTPYTSADVVHIEKQLGYTYSHGSLEEQHIALQEASSKAPARMLHISGINRAGVKGSFVVKAFAEIDGRKQLIGHEAVLSRWAVQGCANCQTHLEVKAAIPLKHDISDNIKPTVEIHGRDGHLFTATLGEEDTVHKEGVAASSSVGKRVRIQVR